MSQDPGRPAGARRLGGQRPAAARRSILDFWRPLVAWPGRDRVTLLFGPFLTFVFQNEMPSVGASLRHHWQQSSGKCQLRLEPLISTDCAAVVRHGAAGLECFSFENKSNDLPLPLHLCTSTPLRLCGSAPPRLYTSVFCLLPPASCLLPSVCLCLLASAIWLLPLPSSAICLLPLPPSSPALPPAFCLLPPPMPPAS
jgi:hypothetical protein